MECLFCKMIKGEVPCKNTYEEILLMQFMKYKDKIEEVKEKIRRKYKKFSIELNI